MHIIYMTSPLTSFILSTKWRLQVEISVHFLCFGVSLCLPISPPLTWIILLHPIPHIHKYTLTHTPLTLSSWTGASPTCHECHDSHHGSSRNWFHQTGWGHPQRSCWRDCEPRPAERWCRESGPHPPAPSVLLVFHSDCQCKRKKIGEVKEEKDPPYETTVHMRIYFWSGIGR